MPEKRRRKKTRIQADSDSESSSSGGEGATAAAPAAAPDLREEPLNLSDSDVEMDGGKTSGSNDSDSSDDSDGGDAGADHGAPDDDADNDEESARMLLHKAGPGQEDFEQFLGMITEQFGDDLETLRQGTFGAGALDQLVAGLKNGINIFSPEQREKLFKKA